MSMAIGFLIAMPLCTMTYAAATNAVWVVTDRLHPVHNVDGARVIEVDTPARVEAMLSANLPASPRQAEILVQQRLNDDNGKLARQLTTAYQGMVDAWNLGVVTVPAVIIDRHYVVYGDPDVAHAVSRIQAYREVHP
ncbi:MULTISPECIES: TIGR03757 family integrating conjugative element protein [unclassified Burkholderia]|uniref:TIGR03757 family integrating conjugative element protein n=1 Tax=unclassified Burkholderia TaxID=2613784 RepID=UPI0009E6AC5B|nr:MULTISPECIES: TIGR03757 family integrating conjugative element protein [unclassified Burkholderia]